MVKLTTLTQNRVNNQPHYSDENDYYSYNNIYDDHNEPNQRNTGLQKEEDINCGEHKYPYLLDDL